MRFIKNADGFTITYKNEIVINHSEKSPFLFAGKGEATFDNYRGNFKIEEKLFERIPLKNFQVEEGDTLKLNMSYENSAKVELTIGEEAGRLVCKFEAKDPSINRLWLRLHAEEKEKVYGLGEQFSHFNLRGKNFPLWTSEQGVGRNKQTYVTFLADVEDRAGGDYYSTFFPAPTFVSSRKYFFHTDESSYMNYNFKNESYHEIEFWHVPDKFIISRKDSFLELVEDITSLLGRQPELPEWIYNGVILGIQGGTDICLRKLERAKALGVPVAGIWAQDWEGKRITPFGKRLMWNWQWNKELYPNLDVEIKNLAGEGVKFLGYTNPYLAIEGNLFREASKKELLVKNSLGEDYKIDMGSFYAGVVDLTNPEAFEWFKKVIQVNLIDFGLAGWMADFGEYLPTDAVLYSGESAELLHNRWPALWARLNYEAVEERGKLGEVFFFMRAGFTGSQKYCTMMWAGDQNVDWSLDDGLASVIPGALSLSMCGVGLHHSDIGGYTTLFHMKRTKELLKRWIDFSAFTPMMRSHEGNRPDDNWQFDSDEDTLLHLGRMGRVFVKLSPYVKSLVKENAERGIAVMRPLFFHYENDEACYDIQYQYLLGRDMLIAPVYSEKVEKWSVYLPEDNWIHLWTGEEFAGGNIEIEAKEGYPPVFYRKQSEYSKLFSEVGKL
jgi:sulfoquinovosidase